MSCTKGTPCHIDCGYCHYFALRDCLAQPCQIARNNKTANGSWISLDLSTLKGLPAKPGFWISIIAIMALWRALGRNHGPCSEAAACEIYCMPRASETP